MCCPVLARANAFVSNLVSTTPVDHRVPLPPVATVDDALELLRDPAYLIATGRRPERRAAGFNEVSAGVLDALQARGAESRDAARDLVRQALAVLGGRDGSYLLPASTTKRPGRTVRPPRQRVEVFLVPFDK